jgi:hypothetical protein
LPLLSLVSFYSVLRFCCCFEVTCLLLLFMCICKLSLLPSLSFIIDSRLHLHLHSLSESSILFYHTSLLAHSCSVSRSLSSQRFSSSMLPHSHLSLSPLTANLLALVFTMSVFLLCPSRLFMSLEPLSLAVLSSSVVSTSVVQLTS